MSMLRGKMSTTPTVRAIAIAHVLAAWFMVGMIWTIHHVHYPLFAEVGPESYVDFQASHVDRIGALLIVPWLTEGVTLLALLWISFVGGRRELRLPVAVGAIAMAMVLAISALWSAPAHADLADGFDAAIHNRLMNANLIRALSWTVRGLSAAWIVALLWPREATTTHSTR